MKLVIIEGIATSGKTSVIKELEKILKKEKIDYTTIKEKETLLPIFKDRSKKTNLNFISKLLKKYLKLRNKRIIIFDRLYLTHIYRTKSNIKDFESIGILLKRNNVTIVLLTIKEEKIKERILGASKHREKTWWKDILNERGDEKDIEEYYIKQQRKFLDFVSSINIPVIILDTTDSNFKKTAQQIFEKVKN